LETSLSFQADLEPGHRGLQPLQVEGLEDLYQRCLSAQTHSQGLGLLGLQPCSLEDLVQPLPEAQSLPRQALAIEVQVVGSQAQPFDKLGDISIEPFVGRLQVVTHGVELALWKMKTLAVYLRFGVVAADELPAAPHGEGLQQIVKRLPVLLGLDKVAAQAGDAHAGQVVVPVAGDEPNLLVEVKKAGVDGRGGHQDELLAFVCAEQTRQVIVAIGRGVAEVVRFVHDDQVGVSVGFHREVTLAEPLL